MVYNRVPPSDLNALRRIISCPPPPCCPACPQLDPVTSDDMRAALTVTKPSARLYESKYTQFSEEYGQRGE